MKNTIIKNQEVFFEGEKLPMTARALSERYVVCTRMFDQKEDFDLVEHKVRTGAYSSTKKAIESFKNEYIYTIIDFEKDIKGPHNMIFNPYSFESDESMEEVIKDLESGDIEISSRNKYPLYIDWDKTNIKK